MDNKTLKALVIKYKDSGLTYQQIADSLYDEYGLSRSRQALQGMYQRAVKNNQSEECKERIVATADIVNVYCLGYSMSDVKTIVNKLGYKLSYNDVVVTIRSQKDYRKKVKESIVRRVVETLKDAIDMESVRDSLKYKEIIPTEKQLKLYIADAYKEMMYVEMSKILARAYQFTDDKTVVRKIITDLNLKVGMESVRQSL